MSQNTPIQWSDDTVNPTMGCSVCCELRPTPQQIAAKAIVFFQDRFPTVDNTLIKSVVVSRLNGLNATEIYQWRNEVAKDTLVALDVTMCPIERRTIVSAFEDFLKELLICYAHGLHLRYSTDVTRPEKKVTAGYAPQFEQVTKFPGRMALAAAWPDLFGKIRKSKPWLDYLPRIVFTSDMGDCLSAEVDFEFLEEEIVNSATSPLGQRHVWLWLTKHPNRMAHFGRWLAEHGRPWPENIMAMSTVTGPDTAWRVEALKSVPARFKGLSVEPLWDQVKLPLVGVDLCIVGGQSGFGAKPFDLTWAQDLQRQCTKSGSSFFLKQLGSNAWWQGQQLTLRHAHGGDWNEWPPEFRVRQMPTELYGLRCASMLSNMAATDG